MSLKKSGQSFGITIVKGLFWSGSGQGVAVVLRAVIMTFLARFLTPEAFGVWGVAFLVMQILNNVSDMGFGAALIQRVTIDEKDRSTIFWFNLVITLALAAMLFLVSDEIAQFFHIKELGPVLRVLGLFLPVGSFALVPGAMLQRRLKFELFAWKDTIGMVGFGLLGLPLALFGAGAWSLIAAMVAQRIFSSLFLFLVSPYWPTLQFSWSRLKSMFNFSGWMFIGNLVAQLINNIDYVVVGRFLGPIPLGYYTFAFQVVVNPTARFINILFVVLFPSIARIQSQVERIKMNLIRMWGMLVMFLAPVLLLVVVLADGLIMVIFSEKWLPAVPLIRIFTIIAFLCGFHVFYAALNAIGKPYWRFWLLVLQVLIFSLVCWRWGLQHGVDGVAWSMVVATVFSILSLLLVIQYELQVDLRRVVVQTGKGLTAAMFAAGLSWSVRYLLSEQATLIWIIVSSIVFILIYIACCSKSLKSFMNFSSFVKTL